MIKKKSAKNTKAKSITHEIDQLHSCIESDQVKLNKTYEKVTATSQKSILRLTTQINKLKQKMIKAKNGKNSKSNPVDQQNLLALQKELDLLKTETSSLSAGYKKFIAQQKATKLFEKEWDKQLTASYKPTAKNKKISISVKKQKKQIEKINSEPAPIETETAEEELVF